MDSPHLPPPPPMGEAPASAGNRAGAGTRFVAALIDSVIVAVVGFVLGAIVGRGSAAANLLGLVIGIVWVTYWDGGASGQTPGKRVMNLRVVDANTGGEIGYARGFIRYIGLIVSTIPCLLGHLWMLWDKDKQTWTDKLSTSAVVKV